MWVHRTGQMYGDCPIILYEYQKTRNASHPRKFLQDFRGVIPVLPEPGKIPESISGRWRSADAESAEQSIRGFCIGKKNWVMIDTVAGALSDRRFSSPLFRRIAATGRSVVYCSQQKITEPHLFCY